MAHWRETLDQMVLERRSALIGYACLFVVDRRDAEDLVHEALVRTFARPRVVTDVHAAEGYVRQAVRTVYLDQARRRRAWRARVHLFAAEAPARPAEEAATTATDVGAALVLLSPRERVCVVLRYFDDLPVSEVAAALQISEGAVKRYLADGTRKLRSALRVDTTEGGGGETVHVVDIGRSGS